MKLDQKIELPKQIGWKRVRRRDSKGFTILCKKCRHAVADPRRVGHRRECCNHKCQCGHLPTVVTLAPHASAGVLPPKEKICPLCERPYSGLVCACIRNAV